jgi:hypothetical protein
MMETCKRHAVPMEPACAACEHEKSTGECVDVVLHEYPDGSGGGFFCATEETYQLVNIYGRRGCRIWLNDLHLGIEPWEESSCPF